MRHSLSTAGLLLALAGHVALALPSGSSNGVLPRDVAPFTIATSGPPFSIGQSPDDPARVAPIQLKQQTFLYGQSPTGTAPFFPAGPLGNATVYRDIVEDSAELAAQVQLVQADAVNATAAIIANGGFKSISDYTLLYKNQWKNSVPEGVDPGMLTNYTSDLLFSMERLSVNPYSIRRLQPGTALPFTLDASVVQSLTGTTLETLLLTSRLFYADHRAQNALNRTHLVSAACDAYFYISPSSGDFLPLAIRTNVGANLVYTPKDAGNDWFLAKLLFNINDFFFAQLYHFAASHEVVEIVLQAGIRTLSDEHPVLAVLSRIGYHAYAYRYSEATRLVQPGGPFDTLFPFPGTSVVELQTLLYLTGAGNFTSNYFSSDLSRRGLARNPKGRFGAPDFKHSPFREDAGVIHAAQKSFMECFVSSYYSCDEEVERDGELQNWLAEANGPAKVLDFPSSIKSRATLVQILTHLSHLVTVVHHTLNTNDPVQASSSLPFHPAALYAPLPITKGATDQELLAFLPPPQAAVGQIALLAAFDRSRFRGTNRTLVRMWDGEPGLLARFNPETQAAAKEFANKMEAQGKKVDARGFDGEGLSQGMPFVFRALDPASIPFYLAI